MQKYIILMIRANFALNNLVVYNKSPIFASSFFCLTLNLKAMGMNRKFNMGKKNEINPNFNPLEFEGFRKEAGLNAFTLSPTRWIEATKAIGLVSKSGRNGGTYAISDIAFKFANWVSVEFELYLVMEFRRLKAKEQEQIGWTAKRELSKINYHIHTDAIKNHLIPEKVSAAQASIIYAEEADVLYAPE